MPARDDSLSPATSPSTVPFDPAGPVLDRAAMLATVKHDLEFLQELVELFLAEAPGLLAQIRAGVGEHNAESVERCAHTLKSALANFGAQRAREAARALETCGREAQFEGAAGLFSALETEVILACQALSEYLREANRERAPR